MHEQLRRRARTASRHRACQTLSPLTDPFKCCDDRRVIDNLAGPRGLLPFLNGRQELLLIGDIGSQRLVYEPGFAAPRRFGQPFELAVKTPALTPGVSSSAPIWPFPARR